MGENADMIMMGFICQTCGLPIDGDAWGFPRCCEECRDEEQIETSEIKK
jgi:hypothetical protein